ncbi:MAG TPA: dienelactone hydrolase family protein [Vicinamibacterales bacterium]|jgi:carboxymethylenebutenolidase
MKRRQHSVVLVFSAAMAIAAPALAQTKAAADPHADHAMEMQAAAPATVAPRNPNLPPSGDLPGDKDAEVKKQLASSPRKSEWVSIKANGPTPLKSYIVYPERKDKAPVVIVVMEIFGLTDWIRGVADQLAKEGFIAIAPDFLSGMGPNGTGSAELGEDGARGVIGKVTDEDKVRILNDVRAYALAMPAANGKVGVVGFCWGGGTAFLYARKQPALNAAVSYYGPMPADAAEFATTKAPVLGLYGGNDARVDANIDKAKEGMATAGATYDPHIFDGAGHGFLRQQNGTGQGAGNMKAAEQAWPLTVEWLKKNTK